MAYQGKGKDQGMVGLQRKHEGEVLRKEATVEQIGEEVAQGKQGDQDEQEEVEGRRGITNARDPYMAPVSGLGGDLCHCDQLVFDLGPGGALGGIRNRSEHFRVDERVSEGDGDLVEVEAFELHVGDVGGRRVFGSQQRCGHVGAFPVVEIVMRVPGGQRAVFRDRVGGYICVVCEDVKDGMSVDRIEPGQNHRRWVFLLRFLTRLSGRHSLLGVGTDAFVWVVERLEIKNGRVQEVVQSDKETRSFWPNCWVSRCPIASYMYSQYAYIAIYSHI